LFVLLLILHPAQGVAETDDFGLVKHGSYSVGYFDDILLHHQADTPFIPASILKIVTAQLALETLSPAFRFETEFYVNSNNDLIIKGLGDPLLISEEILHIALKLRKKNHLSFNNILLDNSSFQLDRPTHGIGTSLNPYDAENGALVVNFNTINVHNQGQNGVISAEPQTPTLPLMKSFGKYLPKGQHRVNISNTPGAPLQYVGELFKAIFITNGITILGEIAEGRSTDDRKLIYSHISSYSLEDVISKMFRYSNNLIANQLFLTCGAIQFGDPATWEKARETIKLFAAQKYFLKEPEFIMYEGSGISRKNRLTANAMLKILEAFALQSHLLPEEEGRRVKTGTLTGVYSLAGYLTKNEQTYPFAIILNQPINTRDLLIQRLEKELP